MSVFIVFPRQRRMQQCTRQHAMSTRGVIDIKQPLPSADWQSSILLCGGGTETAPHSFCCREEEICWQLSSSTVQCLMCNIQPPSLHQAQHLAEGRHPRQGTTMTASSPLSCSSPYWTQPPLVSTSTTRALTIQPDDNWHTCSARTTLAMTEQQRR